MKLQGYCYKFPDNINTDSIISGRYKFAVTNMKELAKHVMEDIDPGFYKRLKPGKSIIVAGENFGMGSSREQAPLAIKHAGIIAVVAKSFARIFYRNSFNIGLPLVETDTDSIKEQDSLEINLEQGLIKNLTRNKTLDINPLPRIMMSLLSDEGVVAHVKKYGGLNL
ncbi:MAG: 3-isopropylmalate dehydratase small subunit [Candidatus Omnitrophica bacterium]|nr:3-isopropylmalate dehydratase small subunit [Candidatus Omnitrophota bacterium]